jgi:membrane protein implicated in regulation of membrane protease activity
MGFDQVFFLAIALLGAMFLLISFILGEVGGFFDDVGDMVGDHLDFGGDGGGVDVGHGDADGGAEGPSPLSLRNLMAFLTAYGASGLITSAYGWGTLASSLFAIIPGLALAFVAYKVMSALYGQQSSSVVEVAGLVGRTAMVEVSLPQGGLGRVTVNTASGRSSFLARAEDGVPITAGDSVIIKSTVGGDLIVAKVPVARKE